jgi:hypothetical protein
MSCPDVKDLLFEDLKEPARRTLMAHVAGCEACSLEYERLQTTTTALGLVPDQEPPVRIRFVSDRVFEQSWWRRAVGGGAATWANAGFALASCLAVTVLIWSQAARPAPSVTGSQVASQTAAAIPAEVSRLVDARVQQAVTVALAESDRRHQAEVKVMLAGFEREQSEKQQRLVRQIEAAWRLEDGLKTRALYAAYEKPVLGQ